MTSRPILVLAAIASFSTGPAYGYDINTHRDMSARALASSVLSQDPSILQDLGLEAISTQTFPNGSAHTISLLIQDGAEFEDNVPRPAAHFYDPVNNRPLTVFGVPIARTSPDWALEDTGQITGVLGIGSQDFSFVDARARLLQALTSQSATDRSSNFGLTFRTLGQVIHHIQDMAQPQHVRNDPHLVDLHVFGFNINPFSNPSAYEKWTESVHDKLPFGGYAPPYSSGDQTTFNAARNFWHPPANDANRVGKGLADFTNRSFVSAGTNFDKPGLFPSPDFSSAFSTNTTIEQLCASAKPGCDPATSPLRGTIVFYGNSVVDLYTGALDTNPRASTLSLFDEDLKKAGKPFIFTLNRFNFAAAHSFLVPRAVGYSAGLLNYFFRGKIDYVPDPDTPGSFLVKNLGAESMKGKFQVYYDDKTGTRRPVDGILWDTEVILASDPDTPGVLAPGKGMPVPRIPQPTLPEPKTFGEFVLVFTGEMGQERPDPQNGTVGAVVGKVIQGAPYRGQLYVAGLDAQGRLATFVVDPAGLRVLNGLDANGVSHSTPFFWGSSQTQKDIDPLFPVVSASPTKVLNKVPRMKQPTFQTSVLGGMSYQLNAVSLILSFDNYLPYVLDPASGRLAQRGSTIRWLARSPDPTIGDFEFAVDAQGATLGYTRTFRPAPGQPTQTSGGTLVLPTDPVVPDAFKRGTVVVSPDGLTVSGIVGLSQPDTFTFFWDTYELRLTLGAQPSVSLVQTEHVNQTPLNVSSPNNTNESTVNTTGPSNDTTSTTHQVRINDGERTDIDRNTFEDYIAGNLVVWRIQSHSTQVDEDYFDATSHFSVTACPGTVVRDLQFVQRNLHQFITTFTIQLDQSLTFAVKDIPKSIPGPAFFNYTRNFHSHDVQTFDCAGNTSNNPTDTQDSRVFDADALDLSPITTGTSLLRALNGKVDGSILFDRAASQFTLRGVVIGQTTDKFIADSSPLGEIFAASTDKSTIVYEPAPSSGMPATIDIPANIIKLIAAIWL